MESANKIRSALEIQKEAVGVKYTDESPAAKLAEGQYAVCNGHTGGGWWQSDNAIQGDLRLPRRKEPPLGLSETREVPLRMLVEGEKLWCDVKTAMRSSIESQKIAKPPLGIARRVSPSFSASF